MPRHCDRLPCSATSWWPGSSPAGVEPAAFSDLGFEVSPTRGREEKVQKKSRVEVGVRIRFKDKNIAYLVDLKANSKANRN